MVHEILHGLGFCSMLKRVDKGVIGDNLPDYGGDYYMPALLSIEDKVAGKMTIKGFLPVNVYEKYFVDIDNPDNYYFDDAFCSLSNVELNYDIHKPPYFIERNNLRNFTNYMESWTGMESGIRFYERSHQPQSVAFKTKSGKLLYICTFVNTSHPDLNHIASPNFRYHSSGKVDEDYKPDIAERIDHNFILYPYNVGLSMSNEEKIEKYGNGKTIGVIGKDIIEALETMGYHRKGTPEDNTEYIVVSQIVKSSDEVMDSETLSSKDVSNGVGKMKVESESDAPHRIQFSLIISFLIITISFMMSLC